MTTPRIVLDTNVVVSGLRSRLGASHRLLTLVGTARFEHVVSVALVLEYEEALTRVASELQLGVDAVDDVLDYRCASAIRRAIHFRWRPMLPDPRDDLVLEAAVAGACEGIVTFNRRDFVGADRFGLAIWTPGGFLEHLGRQAWAP